MWFTDLRKYRKNLGEIWGKSGGNPENTVKSTGKYGKNLNFLHHTSRKPGKNSITSVL